MIPEYSPRGARSANSACRFALARFRHWRPGEPAVRRIGLADLKDAVAKGIDDFDAHAHARRIPRHHLCRSRAQLFRLAFGYDCQPLVYPMLA